MQLIGINGFKRSGKGTVANFIEDESPVSTTVQVGFADKLKIMAARALGIQGSDAELIAHMDVFKEDGGISVWIGDSVSLNPDLEITGRQYLQHFGNDAREVFGDTFWIDQVLPLPSYHPSLESRQVENRIALKGRYGSADQVLLTDLRYPNEAARVRALGGTVVEVIRPGLESDGHASEQPLPRELVDFQVFNTAGLDELRDEVRSLLPVLGRR